MAVKNLHSAPLGKLVATLKLLINSRGRASSQTEMQAAVCSLRNNANNSSFPKAAGAAWNHTQLSSLHPEVYQLTRRKSSTPSTLIKLCKALGSEKNASFLPPKTERENKQAEGKRYILPLKACKSHSNKSSTLFSSHLHTALSPPKTNSFACSHSARTFIGESKASLRSEVGIACLSPSPLKSTVDPLCHAMSW